MTNALEKQFFDTFGIEPIKECKHFLMGDAYHNNDCDNPNNKCDVCEDLLTIQDRITCPYYERDMGHYPTICDRILLELIVLHSVWCMPRLCCFNLEQLKEQLLSDLCLFNCNKSELIQEVQALFEEG